MATRTYRRYQTKKTPQSKPIPGSSQVPNSAGGYSFALDPWKLLDRFLILGSEDGTYYVEERELTEQNAENVLACIKADGLRVVNTIVQISQSGRAPKNDPALFALALCASHGNEVTKKAALAALPLVARIGTHLFHFIAYVENMRGWGRGLRSAVSAWYLNKQPLALAQQVTKYQSRDGWSHRDVLRLAHVKPTDAEYSSILRHAVAGAFEVEPVTDRPALRYLAVVDEVKKSTDVRRVVDLITGYRLPREVIPTEMLTKPEVWEALLPHMGLTAMIRNLGNMSKVGLLTQLSNAESLVLNKLADVEALKKERVHPLAILTAQRTYAQGHGLRGHGEWDVAPRVVDALDAAFYAAFQTVVPTGKRILLALDVSGSMSCDMVGGAPITPREASTAMALVTARTEKNYAVMAFSDTFVPLNFTTRTTLESMCQKTAEMEFGGTDCALPMLWALGEPVSSRWGRAQPRRDSIVEVDAFVIYTDSETWAGDVHPVQALKKYRQVTGIPAKLVVVGMTANRFSIADPADAGMLDVVGFDSAAPAVLNDFICG